MHSITSRLYSLRLSTLTGHRRIPTRYTRMETTAQTVDAPKQGVKRKYKAIVNNVNKFINEKKFSKLLDANDVSYTRAKKISSKKWGEVTFESEELMNAALPKISEIFFRGEKFKATPKIDKQEYKKSTTDNRPRKPMPTDIRDVVTPWHNIPYDQQLIKKGRHIRDILIKVVKTTKKDSRHGRMPSWILDNPKTACAFEGVRESPAKEGYRNKCSYTVGPDIDGKIAIGFQLGRTETGCNVTATPYDCVHISDIDKKVIKELQVFVEKSGHKEWDKYAHTGFWRKIVLRSTTLGDVLLVAQVNPKELEPEQYESFKKEFASYAQENIKDITSLYLQEYEGISNVADADAPMINLFGKKHIYENLCGLKFRISPTAFFQTNIAATEVLYGIVKEWAGEAGPETTVFDICCGTGTIGLSMAKGAKRLIGAEICEEAVEDAIENAKTNGVTNATFIAGKAESTMLQHLGEAYGDTNVIGILDPPRAGMHGKILKAIRDCKSLKRLVYVSCNPPAFVQDAAKLCKAPSNAWSGVPFKPVKAVAVDMFPHTKHEELVVLFERNEEFIKKNVVADFKAATAEVKDAEMTNAEQPTEVKDEPKASS